MTEPEDEPMTRPLPVTTKARARKPETVLRKVRESVNVARFQLNHDRVTGDNWVAVNQALLRALSRMSELRRSLRVQDTKGTK
jgi:hypothetical protein